MINYQLVNSFKRSERIDSIIKLSGKYYSSSITSTLTLTDLKSGISHSVLQSNSKYYKIAALGDIVVVTIDGKLYIIDNNFNVLETIENIHFSNILTIHSNMIILRGTVAINIYPDGSYKRKGNDEFIVSIRNPSLYIYQLQIYLMVKTLFSFLNFKIGYYMLIRKVIISS